MRSTSVTFCRLGQTHDANVIVQYAVGPGPDFRAGPYVLAVEIRRETCHQYDMAETLGEGIPIVVVFVSQAFGGSSAGSPRFLLLTRWLQRSGSAFRPMR
jgi:hypothetical protein